MKETRFIKICEKIGYDLVEKGFLIELKGKYLNNFSNEKEIIFTIDFIDCFLDYFKNTELYKKQNNAIGNRGINTYSLIKDLCK